MPTAEEYLAQGKQHHQGKRYQQAIDAYLETLKLDPTCANAAINASRAYLVLERYTDALLVWLKLKPASKISELTEYTTPNLIQALKRCPDSFLREVHLEALHPKLLESLNMDEIKQVLLERLDSINDPKIKLVAKAMALLPTSFTGSIFYHTRKLISPSLKRGRLHLLAQSLEEDIKANNNCLELPVAVVQALQQQTNNWKNELKDLFPVLHYFLLNRTEAPVQASSAMPTSPLPIHAPMPPGYNPWMIRPIPPFSAPAASAPLVTELNRPVQPYTAIAQLIHKAMSLAINVSDIKAKYLCPLSGTIMRDPTVAADGYTYERSSIVARINSGNLLSPKTGVELPHLFLSPNQDYRQGILSYLQKKIRLTDAQASQLLRASPAALFNTKEEGVEPGAGCPQEKAHNATI